MPGAQGDGAGGAFSARGPPAPSAAASWSARPARRFLSLAPWPSPAFPRLPGLAVQSAAPAAGSGVALRARGPLCAPFSVHDSGRQWQSPSGRAPGRVFLFYSVLFHLAWHWVIQ